MPALFGAGGLADVSRHMDDFAQLGVTALWLSPLTGAPPGDFGYALTDPFHVRKDLGSSADLRELIRSAHSHGIRVMLDFVTNHLSSQHPYFINAEEFGRRSPWFDWFQRDADGRPVHYFDWSSLENLNYDNPEVRHYMLEAITHWFRDFPIDGLRADAAWAVRQRDPAFWPELRRELDSIRPDLLLIAEAPAWDTYYMSHGFDVAYDWTRELGHWAWQGVFGPPGQPPDLQRLRAALTQPGRGDGVLHFLNNNDTGQRFVTVHGQVETRLAAALLLTLPGVPLIYDGDEVGASFEPYSHPKPLQWNDPAHLKPLYTRLIHLRLETPALRSPRLRFIHTSAPDTTLAYLRPGKTADKDVAIVLNFAPSALTLPLSSIEPGKHPRRSWWAEDLLTGTTTRLPADARSAGVVGFGALLLRHSEHAPADGSSPLNSSCPEPTHSPD
jgi:glycosidase